MTRMTEAILRKAQRERRAEASRFFEENAAELEALRARAGRALRGAAAGCW